MNELPRDPQPAECFGRQEGQAFPSLIKGALDLWAQAGEQHWIPIDGHSMTPILRHGDRVLVRHGTTGIRRGDVLVFRRRERLIAHRVLRIRPAGGGIDGAGPTFVTLGDAKLRPDPPVRADEVVGRVVALEREGQRQSLDSVAWRVAGWWRATRVLTGRALRRWLRARTLATARSTAPEGGAQTLVGQASVDLLLSCARPKLDPDLIRQIRALAQGQVDWERLLDLARRHSVIPLLYRGLKTACADHVPQGILARLTRQCQANSRRNVLLAGELVKLLDLFEAQGIHAIPLKGPALTRFAYGDLALRQYGDLDILVDRADVPRAEGLLASQGYRPPVLRPLTPSQRVASLQIHFHRKWMRDKRVLVELHWGLVDWPLAFSLDLPAVWEHRVPVSLPGQTANSLSAEDLLLFLCLHATKPRHRWRRLNWICDVAWLIHAHPDLDWGRVLAEAQRLGSERRLLLGLRLAQELLDIGLPQRVRQRMLADLTVSDLAALVCQGLWDGSTSSRTLRGPCFDLKSHERRRDKARFLWRHTLASTVLRWALRSPHMLAGLYSRFDRTASRYPWLWPLPLFALLSGAYRLLLPVRMAAKWIASVVMTSRRN